MNTTTLVHFLRSDAMSTDYTDSQTRAVHALVVVSSFSAAAVLFTLSAIAYSAFQSFYYKSDQYFVRTHVATFFVSLLMSDLIQAVGSIMNARWSRWGFVEAGTFCTVQGVLKMAADISTAIWTIIIGLHTFSIIFLRMRMTKLTMFTVLFLGWGFIAALLLIGPFALQNASTGPFYGISGSWCWIAGGHPTARITMDYMIMFISAFTSFILYTILFFRLRGNVAYEDGRITFHRTGRAGHWATAIGRDHYDQQMMVIARQMLLYPLAYTLIIVPIAACRFASWTGHNVPFAATIFSDCVYLLSGFVNSVLFLTTRRILLLPMKIKSIIPSTSSRRTHHISHISTHNGGVLVSVERQQHKNSTDVDWLEMSKPSLTSPVHFHPRKLSLSKVAPFADPSDYEKNGEEGRWSNRDSWQGYGSDASTLNVNSPVPNSPNSPTRVTISPVVRVDGQEVEKPDHLRG